MTARVTLDGETVELEPDQVRASLRGQAPEPIRDYWVLIDGVRWPVKQVISLATGAGRHRFESRSARRWMERLGFELGRSGGPSGDLSDMVARLGRGETARRLADLAATDGVGLRFPGMYSWWVDEAGAAELTAGLGHVIAPGLVYAGLAGATRKGGARSANTLWGRVTTMHLGTRYQFSTLRRSLASVLAAAHGWSGVDEAALTAWMHEHLRVVLIPVDDPDVLDDLETEVLGRLDPPLNLAKVPRAPHRQQLSLLRKRLAVLG